MFSNIQHTIPCMNTGDGKWGASNVCKANTCVVEGRACSPPRIVIMPFEMFSVMLIVTLSVTLVEV